MGRVARYPSSRTGCALITHPVTKRPDFTDVFYADALSHHHAKEGMRFVQAGKKKEARQSLREATRWEKEAARLRKLLGRKR